MSSPNYPETPQTARLQLAAELAGLRTGAGLSGRGLANGMDISQSKVSRIESGHVLPTVLEVQTWAAVVGASATVCERLVGMAEDLHTEAHSWRTALRGRQHFQHVVSEREVRAGTVRTFQPLLVPGLLQTAQYARRVFTLSLVDYDAAAVAAAVAARLDRQVALYDPARRFEFLITEQALQRGIGPAGVLLAQYDRIASLSTLENVSIGVLPPATDAVTPVANDFVLFDDLRDGGDPFVVLEMTHGERPVLGAEDVALYRRCWDLLHEVALFDDAARELLSDLARSLREPSR